MKHGWELARGPGISGALLREFIRPALDAVPSSMARRLGHCLVRVMEELETGVASRWREAKSGLEIELAVEGTEDHDIAMEMLLCLGQALWERLRPDETREFLSLIGDEIGAGIRAEIDEQAFEAKCELYSRRTHARSRRRLEIYVRASFAGTAAEYVHCLWHDVTVRTGPEFLAPAPLRRRLELLARWFPPDSGYRLFPRVVTV